LKWVAAWSPRACQECGALDRFDDSVEPPAVTHFWGSPSDDLRHTLAYGAAADSTSGRWFSMDSFDLDEIEPLGLDWYDSTGTYAGTWGPGSPGSSLVRGGKIRAITVDKTGRVWIGYPGAGVDHFLTRPESGPEYQFRTVTGTASLDVWGLVAHGDSIWVLTDRDLRRINRVSGSLLSTIYPTPAGRPLGPRLIDVAPNGDVFVGSEEGVRWYRGDGTTLDFTTVNSPLASNVVHAVTVDRATGAVWFGTAAGLNRFDPGYRPPAPPPGVVDTLHVYPSPATLTGLGVQLRLQGMSGRYSGGIYDVNGRLLRRFLTTDRGQVFWDGRDQDGLLVKPGVYFVYAEGGGRPARARFVLLQ